MRTLRRGVTLVELLITLATLGVLAGVTTLAARRIVVPRADDPQAILADTLRAVLATARPAVVRIIVDGLPVSATVWPDGSIIADSTFGVERFTGALVGAR